ncbi:MAG: hypothetical protein ACYDAY_11530 [Candidatus Dormibacteria bacterium]
MFTILICPRCETPARLVSSPNGWLAVYPCSCLSRCAKCNSPLEPSASAAGVVLRFTCGCPERQVAAEREGHEAGQRVFDKIMATTVNLPARPEPDDDW